MSAQRTGFQHKAKVAAAAAPLIVCAAVMGADSAPVTGNARDTGSVFTANTTYAVTSTEVLEVHEPTWALAEGGVTDGEPAQGTVYWGPGVHEVSAGTTLSFAEGTPMPRISGDIADLLGVLAIIAAIVLSVLVIVRHDVRVPRLAGPLAWRVAGVAARLLPRSARDEYVEEWTAWLQDLRADQVPWHRYFREVVSIVLVAAPQLAVTLRLFPRGSVDR